MSAFNELLKMLMPEKSMLNKIKEERDRAKKRLEKLDILIAKLESDPELESIIQALGDQ